MNELLDRMIALYGYEDPAVIDFARLVECGFPDTVLEIIVKSHEEYPNYILFEEE